MKRLFLYFISLFLNRHSYQLGNAGKPSEGAVSLWGKPVQIKGELKEQVETEAKALNVKSEEVIVRALKSYFREKRIDKIQEKLNEHFGERGILTEEDLFNEVS